MNDKITAEQYFENYTFSYWIFFAATIVVMGSLFGGAGASILFSLYLADSMSFITQGQAASYMLIGLAVVFTFAIAPNFLHYYTGNRKYSKVNIICIYIHFYIYCFSLFYINLFDNIGVYSPIIFTLLAYRTMKSNQYQSFLAYSETIRQDWTGWERCYAKWLTDKYNKLTSE